MLVYILCFIITIFLTYCAERCFRGKKKCLGIIFSIFVILVPSTLAGLRDYSIGTDVKVYVIRTFNLAVNSSSLVDLLNQYNVDIGYTVFNYIVSLFTENPQWILFMTQAVICSLVYILAYRERNNISMTMFMMIYLLTMFNQSLNIARQSMAIAIIIFSYKYLKERKLVKFFVCTLLAACFHSTAILALPIYFINILINSRAKKRYQILIIVLLVMVIAFFEDVLRFMVYDLHLLSERYLYYLSSSSDTQISIFQLVYRMFLVLIVVLNKKRMDEKTYNIMFTLLIINFFTYLLNSVTMYAGRISYYYGEIATLISISTISNNWKKKENKIFFNILMMIFFVTNFIILYVIGNSGETYPYKFLN